MKPVIFAILFLLQAHCTIAFAHPVAQGSIELAQTEDALLITMRISTEQITVERSVQEDAPIDEQWRQHAAYILRHFSISSGGTSLAAELNPSMPIKRDRAFVVFSFILEKPPQSSLTISQNLLSEFDFAPGNPWEATFVVTVKSDLEEAASHLLTNREPLVLELNSAEGNGGTYRILYEYLLHGVHHILSGYDHLLFVSALVLSVATLWDIVVLVGVFTVAHSITLALSTFDIVRLPPEIVEPVIALSIVVMGALHVFSRKPQLRSRIIPLVFFFGLFHGLGFAGGLLDSMAELPTQNALLALLGFSVGVELGHQVVVLPLSLLRVLIERCGAFAVQMATKVLSVAVMLGGVFFFYYAL